jgi:4-amino-4-deoxy-L-arabinose transferase
LPTRRLISSSSIAQELGQSARLLSNDLGAASALAWRTKRPDVSFYNTVGELKYGLAYLTR